MVYNPQYALFYDFHTSPEIKGIGKNFDAEKFAARLEKCGVDFISFPARCNMGMAYYNTKIGVRHYGLNFDFLGEMVAACRRHGIMVNAYFNGGISQEEIRLHPDWRAMPSAQPPVGLVSPYFRTACCNSSYREHLKAMMKEVAENYPVAGFFVDSLGAYDCYCENCLAKMREQNIDSTDKKAVHEFTRRSYREFAREIYETVSAVNKDFLLYFNCLGYEEQADFSTYLDFECIPTKAGCDYEYLPLIARYMRTLGSRPRLNMTGRFHLWGDFGGLRPEAAIRQELLTGLANGMRPNIGDHMLPGGEFCEAAQLQNERILKYLHEREEFFRDSESLADTAILYPKSHDKIRHPSTLDIRGAVRMLCEMHKQFDIISAKPMDWSKYSLLVLPDSVELTDEIAARLQDYLNNGGRVLASGRSGLISGEKFLPQWQCEYLGESDFKPAYFQTATMSATVYADSIKLQSSGAEVKSKLIRPLINHCWDGKYAEYYNPPGEVTEYPFLLNTDQVSHFSCFVFAGYKEWGAIPLRDAVQAEVERLQPEPLFKCAQLPRFVRATLTYQKHANRTNLHLLAHIPEHRTLNGDVIEEDLTVPAMTVQVKTASGKAFSEPEHQALNCRRKGEYLEVEVPQFTGYALIALE